MIKHPLMKYRFAVQFLDNDLNVLPFGNDLSCQLTSVSQITQRKSTTPQHLAPLNDCCINIQDDVTGMTSRAIQDLYKLDSFSVKINMLDGCSGIVKTTILTGCNVSSIEHSDLSYGGNFGKRLNFKFPKVNPNELEEPNVKLLIGVLGDMVIDFTASDEEMPIVSSDLIITYSDVTVV
jgi:hypothetical protein